MTYRWFGKPKSIIFTSLVFVLALLLACGSAAQPQVEQQAPVKETPKDVAVEKQAPNLALMVCLVRPESPISGAVRRPDT